MDPDNSIHGDNDTTVHFILGIRNKNTEIKKASIILSLIKK